MSIKTVVRALTVASFAMAGVAGVAQAETGFGALAGIEAEAMSATEMEAVQGRNVIFAPDPGLTSFNNSIAAALGVTPEMINAQLPFFNQLITNGFRFAPTVEAGLNNLNGIVSQASGGMIPFVPVQSPFPPNFPAANASTLNYTLGLLGQTPLPMLPGGAPSPGVPSGFGFNWCGVSIC